MVVFPFSFCDHCWAESFITAIFTTHHQCRFGIDLDKVETKTNKILCLVPVGPNFPVLLVMMQKAPIFTYESRGSP